jgi:Zn finger protein HypA/HybF involved in hydrogenase expression
MEVADLKLDGNAVAGLLGEIFAFEVTVARSTCAACGAVGEVGSLHAYVQAPGAVVRCPRCEAVLMRIVRSDDRLWLEVRGVRSLEFRSEDG